jgi:hypothetical protein
MTGTRHTHTGFQKVGSFAFSTNDFHHLLMKLLDYDRAYKNSLFSENINGEGSEKKKN